MIYWAKDAKYAASRQEEKRTTAEKIHGCSDSRGLVLQRRMLGVGRHGGRTSINWTQGRTKILTFFILEIKVTLTLQTHFSITQEFLLIYLEFYINSRYMECRNPI